MALAGADRIFELLDQKPEEDNGVVTLVNCKIENDNIVEVATKDISYENVDVILSKMRVESYDFLKNAIEA